MRLNIKLVRLSDGEEFVPTNIELDKLHYSGEVTKIEAVSTRSSRGEREYVCFNLSMDKQRRRFEKQFIIVREFAMPLNLKVKEGI